MCATDPIYKMRLEACKRAARARKAAPYVKTLRVRHDENRSGLLSRTEGRLWASKLIFSRRHNGIRRGCNRAADLTIITVA